MGDTHQRSGRQRLPLVRITSRARWRRSTTRTPLSRRRSRRRLDGFLHTGTLGSWAEAIARRYGWSLSSACREPLVHRLRAAPARPVLRAHYHVAIARHWAPRLNMTLISAAGPHHDQPRGRDGGAAVVFRSTWILARAIAPGVAAQGATVDPSKMRLPAASAATAAARAAAAQSAPVSVVKSQSGATARAFAPVATLLAAGPSQTVGPARRPALAARRVFHEPARAIVPGQPSPPPRDALPSVEVPQRLAVMARPDEDPALINRITDSVMRQMDRRIQAYRERTGVLR